MSNRVCKSRGCKWPVPLNDDICEECAVNGSPAQNRREAPDRAAEGPPPMTPQSQLEAVEVIQADREAAADAYAALKERGDDIDDFEHAIRCCKADDHPFVRAFARHRLAHSPAASDGLREEEGLRAQIAHLESRLAAVDVLVGDGFWNSVHEAFDRAGAPRKSDDNGIVYGIIDRINQLAALNAPDRARGRQEGLEEAAKVADEASKANLKKSDELRQSKDPIDGEYSVAFHRKHREARQIAAAIRALSVPVRGEG